MLTTIQKRIKLAAGLSIGVGLLLVIVLLWVLHFEHQAQNPASLAVKVAGGSEGIRKYLGSPIRFSRFARGRLITEGGNGTADLTVYVRCPLGQGSLSEWAQENSGEWQICSLVFRSKDDTTRITVVDDALSRCERE